MKEKKEQRKLYDNIEFLASIKIFSEWSFNSVKMLFYQTEIVKYSRKQFVYREGDNPKGLFFIRRGEFRVCIYWIHNQFFRLPNL